MSISTQPTAPPALLYRATAEPQFVEVPAMSFLMLDGAGDPNTNSEYGNAISALYSLSYALKFAIKKTSGVDYRVAPLEGLWWAQNMAEFSVDRKADWRWTMMIAQPETVTPSLFETIRQDVRHKKALPALELVRLETFAEGRAAQVLHVGSYASEGPTIARLHRFIHEHGGTFDGRRQKHHEIYLGDPTRTAPERLKTILRQPVA